VNTFDPWVLFVGCAMAGLGGTLAGLLVVLAVRELLRFVRRVP